ncbi:MAG: hypothetical protein EBQ82_07555 [Betaproteobacteria bacterium]|nr:hypothetical protein [Betaproteobacteria bacterium]
MRRMSQTPGFDFSQFVPGFDFLKNLQTQSAAAGLGTSPWVVPTLDPKELDKRIQELKAVQFWLNQNTQAIAATIQALEVQRMTLNTLQGMNLSMGDLAQSLKIKPDAWPNAAAAFTAKSGTASPSAPKPATKAKRTAKAAGASAAPGVDPMLWWGALTQQFQDIAQKTMSDMQQQAKAAGMDGAGLVHPSPAAANAAPAHQTATRKRRVSPRA